MLTFKKIAAAAVLAAVASTASAGGALYAHDFVDHGVQLSPGAVQAVFTTTAQRATLQFRLRGYGTLDGANNFFEGLDYGDYFHLVVNGQEILVGGFVMGGGGENLVLLDLDGATVRPRGGEFGAGGYTNVSVPIQLVDGVNTIEWAYTSDVPQGVDDESWSLGRVRIVAGGN